MAEVAAITRFPVKGLAGVVDSGPVRLVRGRGLRWDRSCAVETGRSASDPSRWNPREVYLHVARDSHIVRFGVDLENGEGDDPTLTLSAPDGRTVTGTLSSVGVGSSGEASSFDEFVRSAPGGSGAERVVRTAAAGLWDWPAAHVSVINLATVRAMEEEAGREIDVRRFRGNLLIDGLPAWSELGLLGRRLRIGTAEVEFFQPTDRCRATTIDPTSGRSDINVPGLLASRFGHMFCGVYARVVTDGTIRAGDRLEETGGEPGDGGPLDGGGEPGWPREARVVGHEAVASSSTSLWLSDPLGRLTGALPGQHLRVHLAGLDAPSWRCYTISGVRPDAVRITVRRDGRVSSALRDDVSLGSALLVSGPFGDVTLHPDTGRAVVLLSAGSGITPGAAMLAALSREDPSRRVRVLHVDRTAADVPLWDEIEEACASMVDARAALHLTRGRAAGDPRSARSGRPERADILRTLIDIAPSDVDVYLCGPSGFTAGLRTMLSAVGVPDEHVHAEVFFSPSTAAAGESRPPSTPGPHRVTAGSTGIAWTPESGSLLDAAEGAGLDWPSGCRMGVCGQCVRRVRSGSVEYLVDPVVPPPAGSVLVCCAAPTSDVEIDPPH